MTRAGGTSRSSFDVLARSLAIGVAAGSRASLGLAPPVLTSSLSGPWGMLAKVVGALGVAAELTGDKLPSAGSRLEQPGPPIRMTSGAVGALVLARRAEAGVLLPVLLGAAGGAAGTWGGAAWRAAAVGRRPDWQAAVVEDAVALSLAAFAVRP
ncbi:hypothetical protein [Oerskovia jenensis]|uniref:hypothetical protein n=1 Tax=Oerskovia jenensis TaxID=162169 RepID=UPI0036D7DAA1